MAEMKLSYTGPLLAPVEANQQVGSVRFIVDGVTVADVGEPLQQTVTAAAARSMARRM